jgi:hypothetical protein
LFPLVPKFISLVPKLYLGTKMLAKLIPG